MMARSARTCRPSPRLLRRLLDYNPTTGELIWKPRPVWLFSGPSIARRRHLAKVWNARWAGKPALAVFDPGGYKAGRFLFAKFMAHRVIIAMAMGEWPRDQVDHINGDPADNRLSNLRLVTATENCKNKKTPSNNKSGVVGVFQVSERAAWQATITSDCQVYYLGSYKNKSDAIRARKQAERKLGFHQNHGRKAWPKDN